MSIIKFTIVGKPVAKGRPRFYRRGSFVQTYTPKETVSWENWVKLEAVKYRPSDLIEGPIRMNLEFMLLRPKSLPKKVIFHIKKPDVDNLSKSIKDALEGIIYKNDSQVYQLVCRKVYSVTECGVSVEIIYDL